jgi:cell division transport system permease protein
MSTTASLTHWFHSHKDSAKKSIYRASGNPLSFLFTTLLIAIAFSIPMGMYTLFSSVEKLTSQWDSDRMITLFLAEEITFEHAKKLAGNLSDDSELDSAEVVNKNDVLEQFKRETNFNLFPDSSSENPLPHIIVIKPSINADITSITQDFSSMDEVQHVQFDLLWFQRLQAFSRLILSIQWIASVLLIFTIALIIINVIRWEISSRQSEIEIIKLLGASDAYVRRPFLYFGGLLGMVGATLAVLIVTASIWIINMTLVDLTSLFNSDYHISHLPLMLAVLVIFIGGWVGILAATLAANQRIKMIN